MIITYEGLEYVRIQLGSTVIALNPPSKKSDFKTTNAGADIVMITVKDDDFNGVENVTRKDRVPLVVEGPGEYEIENMFIRGFATKTNYKNKERINTIYSFSVDDMNVVFMGAIADKNLDPEIKENLGDIDVLFVPIGGDGVLDPESAYELAVGRESKIIIPIHWHGIGEKGCLDRFLKEAGEKPEKLDKLTIKRKDIEKNESQIFIIKPLI